MKVVKIVTHHLYPEKAAELFYEEGIVAVGWTELGDISGLTKGKIIETSQKKWQRTSQQSLSDANQLVTFRDKIGKGDIVIAYRKKNIVAMIGEIESDYYFDDENRVGNVDGGVGYANQRKVGWWAKPRNFNRSKLPPPLDKKAALPGTILICAEDFPIEKIVQNLQMNGLEVRMGVSKPAMEYFVLITGGGEYKDEPEKRYHFKKGIPGSKQLENAANEGRFVYYENGKFYAKGEIGKITSYKENDSTYYYAEVKNFEEIRPINFSEIRDDLSFGYVGQAGIRRISEEDYNRIIGGAREIGFEKEKYAILMSANVDLHPNVFGYHEEHIRRVGATYWGVGFPIDTTRFTLPINGYWYTTDSRKVTYSAKIDDVETFENKQMPKEPSLRPPEYKDEVHRTYFRISKLESLPVPIELHNLHQWDGKKVVRPPQNYVLILEPMVVRALNLQPSLIKTRLMIDENILGQVCANINSGSHMIITGPVGTGKTSLTEDICRAAKENEFCSGYVLTTASSDWTTFDTIGGYMPTEEGKLRFEEGKFLEAIRENKWLIIDEINRADIDKAFGQFFTVLSGQRVELPFKHSNGKTISIGMTPEDRSYFDDEQATYKVGRNWRIISTMNVYDMNFLFEMSYAFMRRFAFVYLDVPEKFEELIDEWCRKKKISGKTKEKLKKLTKLTERRMGPAIIKDIVEYIGYRGDGERELAEAIVAYMVPQLEGLERDKIEKTWNQIGMIFDEKNVPNRIIKPILREIVGIELREIPE